MNGFINLLKPPGITSHDAVAWIRRNLGIKKVGHTGTLDPGAAGVLVIACGGATKLSSHVQELGKHYRAELLLGTATSSLDSFGQITSRHEVPEFFDQEWASVLREFEGEIEQTPPMTSAIKVGGRKLYELARKGEEISVPSRKVHIYSCSFIRYNPVRNALAFEVDCSKGTYVRTLCSDIAARAGTVGHMSFLLRTRVGPFRIEESQLFSECCDNVCLKPMLMGLPDWPVRQCTSCQVSSIKNGQAIKFDTMIEDVDKLAIADPDGRLLALAKRHDQVMWKPYKVFVGG